MADTSSPTARPSRIVWVALALSLTLNLFVLGGLGWSMLAPPPRPATPAERLTTIARSLDLAPTQRAALRVFGASAREATLSLRAANTPVMRQMWAEMAKAQPDEAVIAGLADQAIDNRRVYQRKMAANLMTFLTTLSPDQRKDFTERAARRPGPGDERMGRPDR